MLVFMTIFVLVCMGIAWSCNPEPGPQHFIKPVMPVPTPPPITTGYFEVHNTLNGLPCNQIRCLRIVSPNLVLVGTDGGGLMVWENNSWTSFSPTSTPPFPARTVSAIVSNSADSWLAGTPEGLIRIQHESGWTFETVPVEGPLSRNLLFLAKQGETLFAGSDNGAGVIRGASSSAFRNGEGMLTTGFSCGIFWKEALLFGGGQGVFQKQGDALFPFRPEGKDFGWTQAFSVLGANLLIGGSKGLFRVQQTGVTPVLPDVWVTALGAWSGLTDIPTDQPDRSCDLKAMESLFASQGAMVGSSPISESLRNNMSQLEAMLPWFQNPANYSNPDWAARSAGFFELSNKIYAELPGQATSSTPAVAPLLKGLWIGMQEDGVILYSTDGQRRHFRRENSKLPSDRVTAIAVDDSGETWIGTADAGILRYRKQVFSRDNASTTLWTGEAQLLKIVGDRLFIGTKMNGLLVFDPRTLQQVGSYNSAAPMGFHRCVTGLTLDSKGRLWVTGDAGVWCIDEAGAKGYGIKEGIPSTRLETIDSDADGRVFVAGGMTGGLSAQVAQFNGNRFISYTRDNVKGILGLSAASATQGLKGLGLLDTYMRNFDVKHSAVALALYEKPDMQLSVSALLGLSSYLLIGTREGQLAIFDGEGFKPLSSKGTGLLGPIVGLARLPNGDHVIAGQQKIVLFDGENYTKTPSHPSQNAALWQDLTTDDLNPDIFWAAYQIDAKGGVALYQNGCWQVFPHDKPVKKVAVADPYIFLAEPAGVIRRLK